MILKIFSVYDSATKVYNTPFFMLTNAEAIRAFSTMAMDTQSNICKHSHDFHLFFLGTYDNVTGYVNQDEHIKDLGCADLFKTEEDTVTEMFPDKEEQQA